MTKEKPDASAKRQEPCERVCPQLSVLIRPKQPNFELQQTRILAKGRKKVNRESTPYLVKVYSTVHERKFTLRVSDQWKLL